MTEPKPYRRAGRSGGDRHLLLAVRLTPKAANDAIDGVEVSYRTSTNSGTNASSDHSTTSAKTSALKARVRAVPEKGKANAAVEKLIAKWLGLAKSSVQVVAGSKSRNKTLRLDGDPDDLAAKLDDAIARLG